MNDDVYLKLGARLNQNPVKLPLVASVVKFLKATYTEEQAAIGGEFPVGAHTLESLSKTLDRDTEDLEILLENMADEGLVFVAGTNDGKKEYSLTPFAPGVIEFQLMRGTETPEDVKKAHLVGDMMAELEALATPLYQNPEQAKKYIKPSLRTLTVEEELPSDTTIRSFEQVSAIMDQETAFAVSSCHCRQQTKLTGNPCKLMDLPEKTCMYFGKVADFMVERKFARSVTKEACLDILKACEKAGLVHNINNMLGQSLVLCNCCGCCCDFMVRMKKFRGIVNVAAANFKVSVDPESCIACGECVSRCQMDAVTLSDDSVTITAEYCIGCGNCVSVCPSQSLTMIRTSDRTPPTAKVKLVGLGI